VNRRQRVRRRTSPGKKQPPKTPAQRNLDSPDVRIPSDTPLVVCAVCGGQYFDAEVGRESHAVVFGHRPKPLDR
jgi:hypothetical protein